MKAIGRPGEKGFRGIIDTIDQYEKMKNGEIGWADHVKNKIETIELPAELFWRLMDLDKKVAGLDKCAFPNDTVVKPDGEHELDPCVYKVKEIHRNVTVTISECKNCGSVDISWQAQEDTESVYPDA